MTQKTILPKLGMIPLKVFLCLMVAFLFTQTNASAQNDRKANERKTSSALSMDEFIAENQQNSVVKFYLADPSNNEAASAVKSMYILKTANVSDLTESQIAAYRSNIDSFREETVKAAEALVKEGMDYDTAVKSMKRKERAQRNANQTQKKVDQEQSVTPDVPVLVIPANK